ncbi:hypothetical protein Aperf_G00000089909 [Anoplocephala perfoliata]
MERSLTDMGDYQRMIERANNFMDEIEDKEAFFSACNTTRSIHAALSAMEDKSSEEYKRLLAKQVEAQTHIWDAVSNAMKNIILGNPKPEFGSADMGDYQRVIERTNNFVDETEDKEAFFSACNTTRSIHAALSVIEGGQELEGIQVVIGKVQRGIKLHVGCRIEGNEEHDSGKSQVLEPASINP